MILRTTTPASGGSKITLDPSFDYKPFIPKKKSVRIQTIRGSYTQRSYARYLFNNDSISWKMTTTPSHAKVITTAYNQEDPKFTFTGAYGENYLIDFDELEAEPLGGIWQLSGKFVVICDNGLDSSTPSFDPNHQCENGDTDPNRMNDSNCSGTSNTE